MSLDNVTQLKQTSFQVPRHSDKEVVARVDALAREAGVQIEKSQFHFTISDQCADFGPGSRDGKLQQLLEVGGVSVRLASFHLTNRVQLQINRNWNSSQRALEGNHDTVVISPNGPQQPSIVEFTKLLALARTHFEALDTVPFLDFLDEGTKQFYESRERDLQKLERMQEDFFKKMTEFSLEQQAKQREFQRQLEAEYATRQSKLEEQHQARLKQLEEREAELKRVRAEIDERENRQARRDIYKELKDKLNARNKSFELTEGTKGCRRFTFWFTIALLGILASGFLVCFYRNIGGDPARTNWISVGSQAGFGLAFLGVATFFIRWNHQWFQKHADEEFNLKRLDLDIDRANWLVELAMEWKNITKSEIPSDLIDKLARSLFVSEKARDIDIHPAETLFSAIFGKGGSIDIEFPGKFTMQRGGEKSGRKLSRGGKDNGEG